MSRGGALVPLRTAVRWSLRDLPRGALVLVACSGGPDSSALAAATAAEAVQGRWSAGAVVVDHGLQPGSAEVAAAAATCAAELGLAPVVVERVDVGKGPGHGGPEAAAREARYRALQGVAGRLGAAAVLLGHTLDDQAEGVLLGLGRGSGARSLAGMAAVAGLYRRPLLGLRRDVVRAASEGLPSVDDPHNADPRFARVRVRLDALPTLEAAVGPGVAEALARSAALLRADADALDGWAEEALGRLASKELKLGHPDADGVEVGGLAVLPEAVRTRVLRLLAVGAGVPAGRLTRDHVVAVEKLVTDPRTQGPVALPAGVEAVRAYGRLRLRRTDPGSAAQAPPAVRQE